MKETNVMKNYLGKDYSKNCLKNYCLYLMKSGKSYDELLAKKDSMTGEEWKNAEVKWRKKNALACIYYDGDLKADSLVNMWNVIEGVANFLNEDKGVKFCGKAEDSINPYSSLELLANEGEKYLPSDNELVKLLFRLLELAEQKCNFIMLPSEEMKKARYGVTKANGEEVCLYGQITAMLYHIFEKKNLGQYFESEEEIINWVKRENLEHGYDKNRINKTGVRPFIVGLEPEKAKVLVGEVELRESLLYMVWFLKYRRDLFEILDSRKITMDRIFESGKELFSFKKDKGISIFNQENLYPHDRR